FKIKGAQGDKVTAEVLASMYGASRDAFTPHSWDFSTLQRPIYHSQIRTSGRQSFGTGNFRVYNPTQGIGYPQQAYDQFDWFGFQFGYGRYQLMETRMMKKDAAAPVASEIVAAEMDEEI